MRMKKLMKKVTATCLAVATVFTMTACGKKVPTEPAAIMREVQENSAKVDSLQAKATMKFNMASAGETVDMTMDMDMSIFVKDYKAKISMIMDMGEYGSQTLDTYLVKEEDKYYTYVNMLGNWTKQEMDKALFEQSIQEYSSEAYLDAYTKCADTFTATEETDGNNKVTVLEGVITGEAMQEMIEATGILDQLGSVGAGQMDASLMASLFESLGDLPVKMYVDQKTMTAKKMSMDMTDLMQSVFNSLMETLGTTEEEAISVNACTMDMEYVKYGDVENFELPEEAKNATEVTAGGAADGAADTAK